MFRLVALRRGGIEVRTLLCGLALFVSAAPGLAQFRAVPGREYREFINPVNPVRGEAVVGLSVPPAESALQAAVVHVYIPQPFSGEIRLETATADGRFRGEGVFSGSTKGKEWVPLTLREGNVKGPTQRPTNPDQLSVAARGPGGALYVVQWGDPAPAGRGERLRLYVNSRRADMFVRAGSKVVRCAPLAVPQPVRFDTVCDLLMADVPESGQIVLIRRDQFDEQTQPVKLSLN